MTLQSELRSSIAEWESERARLQTLIDSANTLLGEIKPSGSLSSSPKPRQSRQKRTAPMPFEQRRDQIRKLLKSAGSDGMTTRQLADSLEGMTTGNVRNLILGMGEEIVSSGAGTVQDPYRFTLSQ